MKASARLIVNISGRAYSIVNATAKAVTFGAMSSSKAITFGAVNGIGERTRDTGLHHFIYVHPEQSQEIVWLDPFGIDYTITTSTNLKWKIE